MSVGCASCGAKMLPGTLFCDQCGSTAGQPQVARKLRQASFTQVTDAKSGMLCPGERLKGSGRHVYIIEEAIARSGFGATFRATHVNDAKQVLIKQMLDQASYDTYKKQLLAAFRREARFLKGTKHPALPRGYDSFDRQGAFYLVMDFINGKELAKALQEYRTKKGKIEDGLLVFIGSEIADALEVLHQKGYVYRDLKPQNVMLDGISGRVRLIDFGTLYHPSDRDPLVFESEGYTPAEFLDASKPFHPTGDIYSLGALLYEAATGSTPTFGEKPTSLTHSKRDKRIIDVITRCLDPDPLKRFQKARHVRDELLRLTKKGIWPFRSRNSIEKMELSVLPKTLFPPTCTFCEYCGYHDPSSDVGYCPKCRVPLRVARFLIKPLKKGEKEHEFFLYADETTVGSSKESHLVVGGHQGGPSESHARIFRRQTSLWCEAKDRKAVTILNKRKVQGPVELLDGDILKLGNLELHYSLSDAC